MAEQKTTQELLAQYTGDASLVLAIAIEMIVSDAFYQNIISGMQADGNRQAMTDTERQSIRDHLDAQSKAAQDAIDAMPEDGA